MALLDSLQQSWPTDQWNDVVVLVAVSGGADSICLLHALRQLQPRQSRLQAAHFNHGLRGEAATADAELVRETAAQLGVAFHLGHGDTAATAAVKGDGIEAAAREQRYAFLVETAEKVGARYIATAHTADDQVETVMHRIVRGTGLGGLAGIPRIRPLTDMVTVIRPLLGVRRRDVLQYVDTAGIAYRDDETNFDQQFTRNRIRHDLLPRLCADYNPAFDDAVLRLQNQAAQYNHWVDTALAETFINVISSRTDDEEKVEVPMLALQRLPEFLVREFFVRLWTKQGWPRQGMTADHWDRLAGMVDATKASLSLPGALLAKKSGDEWIIRRRL